MGEALHMVAGGEVSLQVLPSCYHYLMHYHRLCRGSVSTCITMKRDVDDPSGILNLGKTFIQGFSSLINFLKARDKHPAIIFNIFGVILLLVTILKPRMVDGMSLQML